MSVSRRRASVPAASSVPQALPKREKAVELKLADEWTFWYEDGHTVRSEDYKNKVKTIGNFSTVQGFWRYWNAFNFANFPDSCSLSLFKNGISPMWEDPANQNGGRYIVFSNRRDSINKYFSLILAAIGSQFDHHNDICGITIAAKSQHSATVSLWNRSSANKKAISDTLNQVAELTSTLLEKIFYRPHPSNSLCLPGAPVPAARSSSGGLPAGPFYQDPNEPGSPGPQDNDDRSRLSARRASSSQDHRKTRSLASSSQSRKALWQVHKKSSSEAIGISSSSSSSSSSPSPSSGVSPVSSPLIRPRLNAVLVPSGAGSSSVSPSSVVAHAPSSSSTSSNTQKTIVHHIKKTLKSFSLVQTFVGNDEKASFTDFLFPFAALFFISFMLVVSSMSVPQ